MAETPPAALDETSDSSERCSAPGPMAVAPWLVKEYNDPEGKKKHAFYNICGPNNETCSGFIPEFIGTNIYQKPSNQGWLIIVCNKRRATKTPPGCGYGDCFLWNPMTKETIQLPTILDFLERRYGFMDGALSSPPPTTANINPDGSNNCDSMVLILFQQHHEGHDTFVFCRPRETQWRIHKVSQDISDLLLQRFIGSVLYFKGKFYVMCMDYEHQDDPVEHHLEIEPFTKGTDLTIFVKSFQVKKEVCFTHSQHYVESHDELYRVDIINGKSSSEVSSIEVVRLNFSVMEWEKVNCLGDNVLFVANDQSTACCSAAELGFTSGCLYYLIHGSRCLHKFQIESTRNTIILPDLWPTESFSHLDWIIMPIDVQQGWLENMLGSKEDKENGFSTKLEIETSTTVVVNDENQGGKYSGVVEVANYWNNLNEDVVGFIADFLHGLDYKQFRSVSKENRAIIPKVQATSFLSPWLVFSRNHNYTDFSVINPMYNDVYVMNLSDLAGSTILFQKGGWLLTRKHHNIFFYNPFTREMVKLPDMDRDCYYSVVSFSSLPTSSDCIVFAMYEADDQVHIDFIKRGEAHWSSLIFDRNKDIPFLDIAVFHDGAFYSVDYNGSFGVFSVKDKSWKIIQKSLDPYYISPSVLVFLVECGGDLLLVNLEDDEFYKLKFSEMKWVEVESLGEYMLFVSHTSCVSAVAPNIYMKNKIYLPRLHQKDGGIMFYCLETRSYHSLGSQHSADNLDNTEGWFKNCTWIEPNRLMSTTEELDWHKTTF